MSGAHLLTRGSRARQKDVVATGMPPRPRDPSGTAVLPRLPGNSVYTPLRGLSLKHVSAMSEKNEYL